MYRFLGSSVQCDCHITTLLLRKPQRCVTMLEKGSYRYRCRRLQIPISPFEEFCELHVCLSVCLSCAANFPARRSKLIPSVFTTISTCAKNVRPSCTRPFCISSCDLRRQSVNISDMGVRSRHLDNNGHVMYKNVFYTMQLFFCS